MDDPCNVSPQQQAVLIPGYLPEPCPPSHPGPLTSNQSEWDEIDRVVDYLRGLRRVDRVSLLGWSRGGQRAGGYAALRPQKVDRLVLVAPAYDRQPPGPAPAQVASSGFSVSIRPRQAFETTWGRQVQCERQAEPAVREVVWATSLESDPFGATWVPPVTRAPQPPPAPFVRRWAPAEPRKVQAPTLLISGELDQEVLPQAVRDLHADLGSPRKVFLDLACSSHFAQWETRHSLLFEASADWLMKGSLGGATEGSFRWGD